MLADIATVRPLPPVVEPTHAPDREESAPARQVIPLASRRRRFRPAMAAAAAVVALIGGGIVLDQPWHDDSSTQQPQLTAADQVLQAPDAQHVLDEFADGASATVVRSEAEGKAVLLTKDMAARPDGKVYELWLQNGRRDGPGRADARRADQTVLLEGDASERDRRRHHRRAGRRVEEADLGADRPVRARRR